MKLSLLCTISLWMLSVLPSVVGSPSDQTSAWHNNNDKAVAAAQGPAVVVGEGVAEAIGGTAIGAAILGWLLNHFKTPTNITAKPSPSESKDTGVQLLQAGINDFLKKQSQVPGRHYSVLAVRSGVPQLPNWAGVLGRDWGTGLITVNAADGTTVWNFYWVSSGTITITTSNLANDAVFSGTEHAKQDPTNPSQWILPIQQI